MKKKKSDLLTVTDKMADLLRQTLEWIGRYDGAQMALAESIASALVDYDEAKR